MAANPEIIRISKLCKSYGHHPVLRDVSLSVRRGQAAFVIGPSGSGKSTLLRCVNRLEPYQSGELWVEDYLVGAERRGARWIEASQRCDARRRAGIGMVFQRFNLFPNMTALDNVTAGLRLVGGQARKAARGRGMELLDRVGLAARADSYPAQLSGGQQQRVAIARAIASNPSLVLFDEPTSALDPELVGEVLAVIRALIVDGITALIVTHEISFAEEVGDVLFFMDQGRIVESGEPRHLIRHSQNIRTVEFLARIRD